MQAADQRKLVAIMFTDIVGYSALTQRNEALALELLQEHNELLRSILARHEGREVKTIGDSFLVVFDSALGAARCAIEIQTALSKRNASAASERRIQVRIGLHVGDVVCRDSDVFGDGVNIAARIYPIAEPGGICVSEDVARQVQGKVDRPLVRLGPKELKNIRLPVVIHRIDLTGKGAGWGEVPKRWLRVVVPATALTATVAAIIWCATRPEPPPSVAQQITSNPEERPLNAAAISPNGRRLAYVDKGGIILRDMETKETKPLQLSESSPFWFESPQWALAWFPDSEGLLVCGPAGEGKATSIWRVSLMGPEPRKLRDEAWAPSVSPDGSLVAFIADTTVNGSRHPGIWRMDANGEHARGVVVGSEGESFEDLAWAPTGNRIAYIKTRSDLGPFTASLESVHVRNLQTAEVLRDNGLVAGISKEYSALCWMPDGRIVYSLGEGPNARYSNLWAVRVDTESGKPIGNPRQLTHESGFHSTDLSVTADGKRLAVLRIRSYYGVYVAELGRAIPKAPRVLVRELANAWPTAWMRDSQSILFTSDRDGARETFRRRLGAGLGPAEEATPLTPVSPGERQERDDARLSPEGDGILYWTWPRSKSSSDEPQSKHLMRSPTSGGPAVRVLSASKAAMFRCASVPKAPCVLSQETGGRLSFSTFDPSRGRRRESARTKIDTSRSYDWDLSPDGSQIAIVSYDEQKGVIRIINLSDGTTHEVVAQEWTCLDGVAWAANSQCLFVAAQPPRASALLQVDVQGRVQTLWQTQKESVGWPVPSPDGRHLAFALSTTPDSNVWVLEGLRSAERPCIDYLRGIMRRYRILP